jgi:phage shock protein A
MKSACIQAEGGKTMGWLKRLMVQAESIFARQAREDLDELQVDEIVNGLQKEMAEAQVRITNLTVAINDARERAEGMLEHAQRRHDEAKLAVLHGNDDAARRALSEEQSFKKQYQLAVEERTNAEETLAKLRNRIRMIENQVYGLSNQKDQYLARLHTAELEKMTADIKGGIDSRGRAFERLEEKVMRKEIEAEAHREVAHLSDSTVTSKIEEDLSVEEMLVKLQTVLKEEGPTKK